MRHFKFLYFSLTCFCLSYHAAGYCVKGQPLGDLSSPIEIKSNVATFEHALQQASYEGNVIMTQGTNTLHADKLIVKKNPVNDVHSFIATGLPAKFSGLISDDPMPFTATAKTIYYYPDKKLLIFEEDATLNHKQDKFKGPSLSYELDKQVIQATANDHARPTITIQPRRPS